MKEKNTFLASFLNFIAWGLGYFYLNKHVIKGLIIFILYLLIWFFSLEIILLVDYPLILPIIFWIIFWSLWCSIYLAYDVWKTSNEVKPPPLKIKVRKVVRRSKIRAREK